MPTNGFDWNYSLARLVLQLHARDHTYYDCDPRKGGSHDRDSEKGYPGKLSVDSCIRCFTTGVSPSQKRDRLVGADREFIDQPHGDVRWDAVDPEPSDHKR
jgi:hypothetical protein